MTVLICRGLFLNDDQRLEIPSEERITEIMKLIGQESHQHNDIGCESCGYANCVKFAISVAQGLATTEMCHIFSVFNRQEYIRLLRAAMKN